MNAKSINDLPLSGRNYTFLARLTAGVTHGQPEGRGLNVNGWFAANGTRPAQNNYLLDGIDNNSNNVDFLSGAAYVLKPPVDAIAEFKLPTNAFSAEFGRAGGAVLNATLKSGTNDFHGSAWEFLPNDKLAAADFFQNANSQSKGAFKQNQFGLEAGGRIVKNKTFFFADYEGTRIRQAVPLTATVPTAAERASGWTNFSDLIVLQSGSRKDALDRSFPIGTIFDPSTTRAVGPNKWVREPFPGNIIPASQLNPNAVKLLELFPAATDDTRIANNYNVNRGATNDVNAFDVRIDENFSERDQIFGRYSFSDSPRFRPASFAGLADGGGFNDGNETVRTQGAALSCTHSFAPTLINEARVGFNREHVNRLQPFGDDTSDIPAQFGIQGIPQVKGNGGLPGISIGGLSNLGPADWLISERFSNTIQFSENLTKIYGKHTFKSGVELQKIDFPWIAPPTSRGRFSFSRTYTSIPEVGDASTGRVQFLLRPVQSLTSSGNDVIGMVNSVSASNFGGVSSNKSYRGAYFQDDWKLTSRLTLNLLAHGAYELALEVFRFGIDRYPKSSKLRVGLGVGLYDIREYDQAVEALCSAVDLDPADTKPLYFLGKMHDSSPRMAEAVTERLAGFVQRYPKNALANYFYALSLWKRTQGNASPADLDRIESLLKTAVELNPDLEDAHFQLALLHETAGKTEAAIREYLAVLKQNANHEKSHYRLSRLYARTGRNDLASKHLAIYRKLHEGRPQKPAASAGPCRWRNRARAKAPRAA